MKKTVCLLMCVLIVGCLALPVFAAEPVITAQPQSIWCGEGDYAEISVTVQGENLKCDWFLEYDGGVYLLSDSSGDPAWTAHAGNYWGEKQDGNTFSFYFNGIGIGLDGAKVYAEINDGHFLLTTEKAVLNVSSPISFVMEEYVNTCQGEILDIVCSASDSNGGTLSYTWYASTTEDMMGMIAVNRGSETAPTLRVPTDFIGVTFYCCLVESSMGYSAYSPLTRVIVYERPYVEAEPPVIHTSSIPDAVAGEPYSVKLDCSDGDAVWEIYYNPGKDNSFDATGLTLTQHGEIEGTPLKAGTYGFTVAAIGAGGEDYVILSLKVNEPAETTAETKETESAVTDAPGTQPMTTVNPSVTAGEPLATQPLQTTAPAGAGEESLPVTSGATASATDASVQTGENLPSGNDGVPEPANNRWLIIALLTAAILVLIVLIVVVAIAGGLVGKKRK